MISLDVCGFKSYCFFGGKIYNDKCHDLLLKNKQDRMNIKSAGKQLVFSQIIYASCLVEERTFFYFFILWLCVHAYDGWNMGNMSQEGYRISKIKSKINRAQQAHVWKPSSYFSEN